eukprot:Pgem_evm1s19245
MLIKAPGRNLIPQNNNNNRKSVITNNNNDNVINSTDNPLYTNYNFKKYIDYKTENSTDSNNSGTESERIYDNVNIKHFDDYEEACDVENDPIYDNMEYIEINNNIYDNMEFLEINNNNNNNNGKNNKNGNDNNNKDYDNISIASNKKHCHENINAMTNEEEHDYDNISIASNEKYCYEDINAITSEDEHNYDNMNNIAFDIDINPFAKYLLEDEYNEDTIINISNFQTTNDTFRRRINRTRTMPSETKRPIITTSMDNGKDDQGEASCLSSSSLTSTSARLPCTLAKPISTTTLKDEIDHDTQQGMSRSKSLGNYKQISVANNMGLLDLSFESKNKREGKNSYGGNNHNIMKKKKKHSGKYYDPRTGHILQNKRSNSFSTPDDKKVQDGGSIESKKPKSSKLRRKASKQVSRSKSARTARSEVGPVISIRSKSFSNNWNVNDEDEDDEDDDLPVDFSENKGGSNTHSVSYYTNYKWSRSVQMNILREKAIQRSIMS